MDLQSFIAVAETGSFQRAASEVKISQSALTRRIQKLERNLGARLIERTTRTLKMTLAGKGFFKRAQSIIDEALETQQFMVDEGAGGEFRPFRTLTIAAIPTATQNLIPRAIIKFRANDHRVAIKVLDHFANDVAQAVLDGEADFGISFIPVSTPELRFQGLIEDRFVLAMLETNNLYNKKVVSWQDINVENLILPAKGTGNRMVIDEALAREKISLSSAYEVRQSATNLGLVEAGIGVSVLPEIAIPKSKGSPIGFRPLVNPVVTRMIGIIAQPQRRHTDEAERFLQCLSETVSF
ncbi:MAG: LysR family transcriptional regulator [Methyloligellaceae bacterium]